MAQTYTLPFDADAVFELLTDPDYQVQRGLALGEKDIECEVEIDGNETLVMLARTMTRDLPKALAKLFKAENRTVTHQKWQEIGDTKLADVNITVEGQPVTVSGTYHIEPTDDGGCIVKVDLTCKAKIPLVGKKVEAFVLKQTEEGSDEEFDYLTKKLAGAV